MTRWRGCLMINPYCPDDLCTLAPGHEEHMHCLETMPQGEPDLREFPMFQPKTTYDPRSKTLVTDRVTAAMVMKAGAVMQAETAWRIENNAVAPYADDHLDDCANLACLGCKE